MLQLDLLAAPVGLRLPPVLVKVLLNLLVDGFLLLELSLCLLVVALCFLLCYLPFLFFIRQGFLSLLLIDNVCRFLEDTVRHYLLQVAWLGIFCRLAEKKVRVVALVVPLYAQPRKLVVFQFVLQAKTETSR